MTPAGLPHSDTHGSPDACSSPWLFAACRVLPRLPAPRHPPCALTALDQFPLLASRATTPTTESPCPPPPRDRGSLASKTGPPYVFDTPMTLVFFSTIPITRIVNQQVRRAGANRARLISRQALHSNDSARPVNLSTGSRRVSRPNIWRAGSIADRSARVNPGRAGDGQEAGRAERRVSGGSGTSCGRRDWPGIRCRAGRRHSGPGRRRMRRIRPRRSRPRRGCRR
jgi:hypothetical protein